MKLRQLIAYRNSLDQFNVTDIRTDANVSLQRIMHEIDLARVDLSASQDLELAVDSINSAFGNFRRHLETLKQQLAQEIEAEEKIYYSSAMSWYFSTRDFQSTEDLLKRQTRLSNTTKELILNRVQYHSGWKYPSVILAPALTDLVDCMVSSDPLYLLDVKSDLLEPVVKKFNQQYQNRLCCYIIEEKPDQTMLESLPNNQVGLCVAVDFFNFRPLDLIQSYLTELFEKLRPGGVVAVTINDCDHVAALRQVENGTSYYTPGSAVIDAADDIGYELTYQYHGDGEPVTWLEFRRPGTLTSLRGGQTLAKIIPKQL